ncbi:hypothetical protein ACJMK2_009365 [Sinanodonta woodiana]|uniref:Uncharacterized protein n=1 Tax=Sinanodonta woodiana TaxID=1069815 RepID=A0ABD3VEE0_SINWO
MSGSSAIEDPGIPLVNRANGTYFKYVEDDVNQTTTSSNANIFNREESKFYSISYRLSRRKRLFQRRLYCVNCELALAIISIIVMLIETELFIAGLIDKTSATSIILKLIISGTTVLLWVLIIVYHATGIEIHMSDNGLEDWRLAVRVPWTYVVIITEIVVCSIHPIPGNILIPTHGIDGESKMVSLDAIFSILMLGRLYLVGRFLVVHSKLLTDTSSQSLGALNKVKINTAFVFKALMSSMPGTMLITIMVAILFIDSWAMRTCEVYYHPGNDASNFLNSMWLISITFLTIGYGDIYPSTYCGRVVSVVSGLMGVGTTALLVAVLASKLEQSRAEKYVHNFVSRVQLDKTRKAAASDVIKQSIKLWKMRMISDDTERRLRTHGKLLKAIHAMKDAKSDKESIGESAVGLIEINKSVNDIYEYTEKMKEEQSDLKAKVSVIENKLFQMDGKLDVLVSSILHK